MRMCLTWRCAPRRYVQNGFNISTVTPNVGKGQDLKRIMMACATPIPGGRLLPSCAGTLDTSHKQEA